MRVYYCQSVPLILCKSQDLKRRAIVFRSFGRPSENSSVKKPAIGFSSLCRIKKILIMFSLESHNKVPKWLGSRNFLKSFLRPPVIESTGLELKPLNPVIAMLTETSQRIFILESQKYKDYFWYFSCESKDVFRFIYNSFTSLAHVMDFFGPD